MVLKDLYNISRNVKSIVFVLVVLMCLIPTMGMGGYTFISAIMCGMTIITTFSFDDNSKWTRYAMIMPVTKKELVAGKFIVLSIFCLVGSVFGLTISALGGILLKSTEFDVKTLLFTALSAFLISLSAGGLSIPLVFKFGAEKGRMLLIVSFVIPFAVCFGIYKLLEFSGIAVTDSLFFCTPILVFIWCFIMYRISLNIFEKQDL